MSGHLAFTPAGTTEVVLSVVRSGQPAVEVTSPISATSLTLNTLNRRIELTVVGGPPGPKGDEGDRGPSGLGNGFGWVDLTDVTDPADLDLPAGESVEIIRDLVASEANNKLGGPWEAHEFWDGSRLRARALGDSVFHSIAVVATPAVAGGSIVLEIDVGGAVGMIFQKSLRYSGEVGEPNLTRFDFAIPVRSAFFANGGKFVLRSSVPATLHLFSPEIFPWSYEA